MIDRAWKSNQQMEDPCAGDICKAMHNQKLIGNLKTITASKMQFYKSGPPTKAQAMKLGFDMGELRHYLTYAAVLNEEEREISDMVLSKSLAPFHTENGRLMMHIGEGFGELV